MSMTGVEGYPLYWPVGWKRTPGHARKVSQYKLTFMRARDELDRQLRLMGGRHVVISTNVPLRRDGLPLAGMREPEDPGVAVYWNGGTASKPLPRVMACDCWRTVRENLRAVAQAVEGLRAIERSGASDLLERAYSGFAALPANTSASTPHWREVFRIGDQVINRGQVEDVYRALVHARHPDAGGSHEQMIELNRAREQALKELS